MAIKLKCAVLVPLVLVSVVGCGRNGAADRPPEANIEWFFIVAQPTPHTTLQRVGKQFQEVLGSTATPGDLLHLIAVPGHTPVATVIVPTGERNSRLRNKQVKQHLPQIKAMLEEERTGEDGQVQLPMLAATIASLRRTSFPCRIVIVGSPLYIDSQQRGWSMTGDLFPLDGALSSPQSPFSDPIQFPEGTKVSWLTPGGDWGAGAEHRLAVTRFIRLFFATRRATLVRMTADSSAAFKFGFIQFDDQLVRRNEAAEMKHAGGSSTLAEDTNESSETVVPIHKPRPVIQELKPVEQPPVDVPTDKRITSSSRLDQEAERILTEAEGDNCTIAIAICWTSEDPTVDIDLRISNAGSSREMYFGHMKTDFGELYRDVRKSGSIVDSSDNYQNWEWARIDHNRTGDLSVWINAFRTKKPVTVRVIKVINGQRSEQTINLDGADGDSSATIAKRPNSRAWRQIQL